MLQMKPLQLKAYDYMKEMLQKSYFKPGVIYSETKIASEIGVSRTPFRDAIHRLMQEGYVDIIPSKGFQLHEINENDVIETFQMRAAIEGYCATDAARKSETEHAQILFGELEDLLEKQKKCASEGDIETLVKFDNEFHTKLVEFAGNSIFNELFELNLYRIRNFASSTLMLEGRVEETLGEHEGILDAMKEGDWKCAEEAVRAHMDRPQQLVMSIMGEEQ